MPGLIIRSDQLQTLDAYSETLFVGEMVEHLKSYSAKLAEVIGDKGLHRIVEAEIRHAGVYGIISRGPVRFFLELTCTFGYGFDTDPQYPWASETLNDGSLPTDIARTDLLYERMLTYIDTVAGPDQEYAVRALKRLLERNVDLAHMEDASEERVLRFMADFYPEKFEFIGHSVAGALVQQARQEAAAYGLPDKGTAAVAGMKFAMGHLICEDPYYPWIGSVLRDPLTIDGGQRLARLLSKLNLYGTHVLSYFAEGGS